MKILFIAPSLCKKWGGTTTSILNFYHAISAQGVYVEIWATRSKHDVVEQDVEMEANIHFFASFSTWRYSNQLEMALKQDISRFDIVHIHGMWLYPHFIAAKIAKRFNVPYIISPHGMVETDALARKGFKKKIYWMFFEQKSFTNAAAIHAITDNENTQIYKLCPLSSSFMLPNGIEVLEYNPKKYFSIEITILFVGRIHPIKGLDRLILAIKEMPDIRLIVAGDGDASYKNEIFTLVDRLELSDRIEFVGFVGKEEKVRLYAKSSFMIVPSHSEVLSLVALEAISYGLPVLISKACHFEKISTSGSGIVINDNKPITISNGIRNMVCLDMLQMSQNAFKLSKEYAINKIANKMFEKYTEICKKCENESR